jgi:hypothetical protein
MNDSNISTLTTPVLPARATQGVSASEAEHKFAQPTTSANGKPTAAVAGTAHPNIQQQNNNTLAQSIFASALLGLHNSRKRPLNSTPTTPDGDEPNPKELRKTFTLDLSSRDAAKKSLQTPDILDLVQLKTPELHKLFTQGMLSVLR